ncbi:MAG: HNH endonuclease, partial [Spirochaetia bacterium]|nr:HNH endonuclease [Spirochaetia bacterium]
ANNKCELCNSPAPFYNRNGEPYFEIHHLIPLSEGGEDTIYNTVCLCPNCHRELHYGKDAEIKTKKLKDKNITQ